MQVGNTHSARICLGPAPCRGTPTANRRASTSADRSRRIGWKKAEPVKITPEQAAALKEPARYSTGPARYADDMPAARSWPACGLRVAALTVNDFDLQEGTLRFLPSQSEQRTGTPAQYGHPVRLNKSAFSAGELIPGGLLLRRSKKNEELGNAGMSDAPSPGGYVFWVKTGAGWPLCGTIAATSGPPPRRATAPIHSRCKKPVAGPRWPCRGVISMTTKLPMMGSNWSKKI